MKHQHKSHLSEISLNLPSATVRLLKRKSHEASKEESRKSCNLDPTPFARGSSKCFQFVCETKCGFFASFEITENTFFLEAPVKGLCRHKAVKLVGWVVVQVDSELSGWLRYQSPRVLVPTVLSMISETVKFEG